MKELARLERLGDAVREVEPGHRVVRDFGVEPHHVGMVERVDEREHVPDGRQEDVAARLVRLRLQRELQVVLLRAHVLAQEVDRVAEPLDRFLRVLGGVGLDALAPAPEHVGRRAELDAEVDRRASSSAARSVRTCRSLLVNAPSRKTGSPNRFVVAIGTFTPDCGERGLELAHDAVAIGRRGVARDEIVVVKIHAVGAELAELLDDAVRAIAGPDGVAERIAARVADGPEPEREVVLGCGACRRREESSAVRKNWDLEDLLNHTQSHRGDRRGPINYLTRLRDLGAGLFYPVVSFDPPQCSYGKRLEMISVIEIGGIHRNRYMSL